MSRGFKWVLSGLGALFLLGCMGCIFPVEGAFWLVAGWVWFLARVVPEIKVDWAGVAMGVMCLVLFAGGSHAFLGWLHREAKKVRASDDLIDRQWSPRWTASLVAVVVLMFVAGMAAAGMVHQIGWLVTSRQPLLGGHFEATTAARRAQSVNNLKQIGVGLYNYHEKFTAFPPGGTFDEQGQPLHGWQALLLPYMEELALYNRIHFEKPWSDPVNAPQLKTQVSKYLNPAVPIQNDAAGYALSHYAGNVRVLGGDASRVREDMKDGASSTFLAGEVAGGFKSWGYPTNWRDPSVGINRSPDGFGSPYPGGANFLFVDGSVRFLKDGTDPRVLKALSTPAGGEHIAPYEY